MTVPKAIAVGYILASYVKADFHVPESTANFRDGVNAILAQVIPGTDISSHGCHCSRLSDTLGFPVTITFTHDDLDGLCREWFQARRCVSLSNGDCDGIADNSYTVQDSSGLVCDAVQNPTACSLATCQIDAHFVQLVQGLLKK